MIFFTCSHFIPMKLTRQQIREGLDQMPIDEILLTTKGHGQTLTHKQKVFAEEIAKGSTKAGAYRKAYNSKAKVQTQTKEAIKLMNDPKVSHHIDSIKVAIEAQKYLFPAHLRALAIQQLTEKALNPAVPPAIQVKCLELIGKMSDVALFQERKEIKQTDTTSEAKQKLINSLANAIRSSRNLSGDRKKDAEDLLREITGDDPVTIDQIPEIEADLEADHDQAASLDQLSPDLDGEETAQDSTPPTPTPQNELNAQATTCHSIPDKQSPTLTETPPLSVSNTEGEGVSNFWKQFEDKPIENTPLSDSGSPTSGGNIPDAGWTEK